MAVVRGLGDRQDRVEGLMGKTHPLLYDPQGLLGGFILEVNGNRLVLKVRACAVDCA